MYFMELIRTTAVDEIGRIVLPRKTREENGWVMGTKLDLYDAGDGTIVIKLAEQKQG